MTKSRLRKEVKKQKRIKELRDELAKNDEILRKNTEQHKTQVQVGLYRLGYPQSSPMYDSLIEKMNYDLEEFKIKLDSGFKVVNPTFAYQQDSRWIDIQIEIHQKMLKVVEGNMGEIKKHVEEVETAIVEQNARIESRKVHILEELEELGEDISKIKEKSPNYIG